MNVLKFILLAVCGLFALAASAQKKEYILILDKANHKMIAYDYLSLNSITSVATGDDPHEIVTTPDGGTAYISNPVLNGNGHRIDVIDLRQIKARQAIDTRPFYIPHGLVYRDSMLWFTAQGSKAIAGYNTLQQQVSG
ncbi:MAG: YncE family protein, partial [Sphingobacteriales bacterium]